MVRYERSEILKETKEYLIISLYMLNQKVNFSHVLLCLKYICSWKDVFRDTESEIDFFMWSIGSQPGHWDIMEFTRENSECGINSKNRRLDIKEGYAYYITVKVKVNTHI